MGYNGGCSSGHVVLMGRVVLVRGGLWWQGASVGAAAVLGIVLPLTLPTMEEPSIVSPASVSVSSNTAIDSEPIQPHLPQGTRVVLEGSNVVVVGDSTISLGNGKRRGKSEIGCVVEEETWATLLPAQVRDYSCSGYTARGMTQKLDKVRTDLDTNIVFITLGSNDVKSGKSYREIHQDMDEVRSKVKRKWPSASIVFVGYLPVPTSGECVRGKWESTARFLHTSHQIADEVMKITAEKFGDSFIDLSGVSYDLCGSDSLVRTPGSSPGTSWHTTVEGHGEVARMIRDHYLTLNT